jgi:hypothetical protein
MPARYWVGASNFGKEKSPKKENAPSAPSVIQLAGGVFHVTLARRHYPGFVRRKPSAEADRFPCLFFVLSRQFE